ncbi:MAG: hypothetical protein IJ744_02735 [Lachnospiraceae bacterium]|nr:hypothetical protein [Lachnospiraceae bacterium]
MRKKVYDGTLVKALDPVVFLMPFIMPRRCDSEVFVNLELDLTKVEPFLKEQKKNIPDLTLYHIVFAAITRAAFEYPQINRFIVDGGIYQRDHVKVSMMVKKEFAIDGKESSIFPCFEKSDTLEDMVRKCRELTEEAFADTKGDSNDFDALMKILNVVPSFATKAFIDLMFWLDGHGRLPKVLTTLQPFHSSFFVTNVGSIGLPVIFHHLYQFGTVSGFISFGRKEWKLSLDKDGNVKKTKILPATFLADSRICDGYSYSCAFRAIKKCFDHPEVLLKSFDELQKEKA